MKTMATYCNARPDLHADKCLERVQLFLRDEIARRRQDRVWSPEAIYAMESLVDDFDELVRDILRGSDDK